MLFKEFKLKERQCHLMLSVDYQIECLSIRIKVFRLEEGKCDSILSGDFEIEFAL